MRVNLFWERDWTVCQAAWNTLVIRELNLVAMRLKGGLSVPVETAAPTGLTPDKRWIMDGWMDWKMHFLFIWCNYTGDECAKIFTCVCYQSVFLGQTGRLKRGVLHICTSVCVRGYQLIWWKCFKWDRWVETQEKFPNTGKTRSGFL